MVPTQLQLRRFYSSAAWQRLRKQVLERDEYVCLVRLPRCTVQATEVDHIIPVRAAWSSRLDPTNCRASCASCNQARKAQRRHPPELEARIADTIDDFYAGGESDDPTPSRDW